MNCTIVETEKCNDKKKLEKKKNLLSINRWTILLKLLAFNKINTLFLSLQLLFLFTRYRFYVLFVYIEFRRRTKEIEEKKLTGDFDIFFMETRNKCDRTRRMLKQNWWETDSVCFRLPVELKWKIKKHRRHNNRPSSDNFMHNSYAGISYVHKLSDFLSIIVVEVLLLRATKTIRISIINNNNFVNSRVLWLGYFIEIARDGAMCDYSVCIERTLSLILRIFNSNWRRSIWSSVAYFMALRMFWLFHNW